MGDWEKEMVDSQDVDATGDASRIVEPISETAAKATAGKAVPEKRAAPPLPSAPDAPDFDDSFFD